MLARSSCAFAAAVGLLLFAVGARAGSLETYAAKQAYAAADACMNRISGDCQRAWDHYVDAAERVLRSERHPQSGQELRLRGAQRKLRTMIAVLNADAVQTVTLALQTEAEALQRIVQRIDALLGSHSRPDGVLVAPAAPTDQVQVVELLPVPAAPQTETLMLWAETSVTETTSEHSSPAETQLLEPRP